MFNNQILVSCPKAMRNQTQQNRPIIGNMSYSIPKRPDKHTEFKPQTIIYTKISNRIKKKKFNI